MFAPLTAKPQAKTAGQSSDKSALRRAAYDHDWDIEQTQTSRRLPKTGPRFPGNESPGGAWDFSKIPLYPQGRGDGPERPLFAPVPRLPGPIQRKLTVGQVDDPLEHEADRVADQVMRMPAPGAAITSAPPQISRKCDACEEEDKKLQKKEAGPAGPALGEAPAIVHEVLRSPGEPLDAATRAFFEPRFGRDFSGVRVHTGSSAGQSARDVNAHAYTLGHDIVFGESWFAPGTHDGRRLLAHELTHVVQQNTQFSALGMSLASRPDNNSLEQEAYSVTQLLASECVPIQRWPIWPGSRRKKSAGPGARSRRRPPRPNGVPSRKDVGETGVRPRISQELRR